MSDHFHERTHDDELQVLVPGMEDRLLAFNGRPDCGTVTCYAKESPTEAGEPLFEVDAEYFEFLLEQASGALIDARGGQGGDAP